MTFFKRAILPNELQPNDKSYHMTFSHTRFNDELELGPLDKLHQLKRTRTLQKNGHVPKRPFQNWMDGGEQEGPLECRCCGLKIGLYAVKYWCRT